MTGRERKPPKPAPTRQSQFFINGTGIDREVITTDIYRYLGNDTLVRPGTHQDPNTGQIHEGFYITAYRPPTNAQLADLRADSLKWQEERRKNNARNPGGYTESATRQAAIGGGSVDDRQQGLGGQYGSSGFAPSQPLQPPMQPRVDPYSTRVAYATTSNAMPPPAAPFGANRNPGGYPTQDQNYVFSSQPRDGYGGTNENRMEAAPQAAPWGMPSGSGYSSAGAAPSGPGYAARPTYGYASGSTGQPVPPNFGRAEPQVNYNDPYNNPRDSGVAQPDPQEYGYANEDESMDFDEPATTATQPTARKAPQRERERDSRERHEEPKRRHGRS